MQSMSPSTKSIGSREIVRRASAAGSRMLGNHDPFVARARTAYSHERRVKVTTTG